MSARELGTFREAKLGIAHAFLYNNDSLPKGTIITSVTLMGPHITAYVSSTSD